MGRRLLVLALLIGSVGCGMVGGGSPEQKAVREYLRKNLDSGKWEEVEWLGPKDIDGRRMIYLKYRTNDRLTGAMQLRENTFAVEGGMAESASTYGKLPFTDPEEWERQREYWRNPPPGPVLDFNMDMDSDGDPNN